MPCKAGAASPGKTNGDGAMRAVADSTNTLEPAEAGVPEEAKALTLAERWQQLVAALPLPSGALREFAHNAVARSWQNGALTLTVDAAHSSLASAENVQLLTQFIEQSLGKALSLQIMVADADLSASPAHVNAREFAARAQAFADSITDRPLVRELIQQFNATVVPSSIYFSGSRAV